MKNRLLKPVGPPISEATHLLRYTLSCLLLSLSLFWGAFAAQGQTTDLRTSVWAATADEAVELLANEATSSQALEEMRSKLSEERSAALEVQDGLKARVDTLEAELATLGEAPAEGETEAAEIAARRAELTDRIAEAKAPLLEAQAAFERADGLIGEIDDEVRGRLSRELTSLGPSPLNPAHWPKAASELVGTAEEIGSEFRSTLSSDLRRNLLFGRVPFAALLILAALVVQFGLKPRLLRETRREVSTAETSTAKARWRFVGGAVRNLLPVLAVVALILGLSQLDPRTNPQIQISDILVPMAAVILVAYWLANANFPRDAETGTRDRKSRSGRRAALAVATVLALMMLVRFLALHFSWSAATLAIALMPLFILGGVFLVRLALLVRAPRDVPQSEDETPSESEEARPATTAIRSGLARFTLAVAVIAPTLSLIGYLSAATALFGPTVYTLALIGALVVLYTGFRDSVDTWFGTQVTPGEGTGPGRYRSIPLFGGLILVCAAIPILALIWGARMSELQEVWFWMRDGISVGDVRLSVTDLLSFVLIFAIGYTITRMLQAIFKGTVLPRTNFDRGASNAIVSGIGYVGIFLSAVLAISATGLSLSNLAIVAGALSVGIGFGLQTIVSNFVSGIILLIERPIKEGDWIEVAGFSGYVRKISVRSTLIDTFDRASVIVPNSELIAGTVLNWTHSELTGRVIVPVGVAYGSDPRHVERVLREIADSHPMVLRRPGPSVVFQGFGADSMDFEIRAFLRDVNWMLSVKSEMNFLIAERFAEEGIEIPFAQRDVNLRNVGELAEAIGRIGGDATD